MRRRFQFNVFIFSVQFRADSVQDLSLADQLSPNSRSFPGELFRQRSLSQVSETMATIAKAARHRKRHSVSSLGGCGQLALFPPSSLIGAPFFTSLGQRGKRMASCRRGEISWSPFFLVISVVHVRPFGFFVFYIFAHWREKEKTSMKSLWVDFFSSPKC